ncbi:DUF6951 family protein [Thermanaeromonas sp. C210]|uniref:DUF6951 family protein n=1 Tax=Thermanaeromonas sp. C210 TaxID=2731925 RepID=UPI0035A6346A
MAYAKIDAGICGFITEVEVTASGVTQAGVKISSTCPNIQKIAAKLTEVNPLEEIGSKNERSRIRELFRRYSPHAACPVPSGVGSGRGSRPTPGRPHSRIPLIIRAFLRPGRSGSRYTPCRVDLNSKKNVPARHPSTGQGFSWALG